ncbi:MAG: NAD(P)/FAD-dependent oxidoreductase [Terriglobia bacterium]|nr:NAD(P)/FAD-dependent oxidoreductase [Terriglobia bacterium]
MDSCDIVIVGGGPAGSSCAWALRNSGLDVLIVDRAKFPRDKLCGGWITPLVVEELELDIEDYARLRTLQPITSFKTGAIGQREVYVNCGKVVSYGIRRCEFDDYLLRRSGARLREDFSIISIERTADGWLINDEIRARMLVGAGGHFCPVARWLGNGDEPQPVVAREVEFEMTPREADACTVRGVTPELYFCRDLAGYGWLFRKGNFLNIGLGRLDPHKLPEHLNLFAAAMERAGKFRLERPRRYSGHAYFLFGHSKRKVVEDAVLLIGDSAGLAYPQSGEGIRPAVESGLMAAEVIRAARGDYGRQKVDRYAVMLRERFASGGGGVERWAKRVPPVLRNLVGRQLLKTNGFGRVVVQDWFLHMRDAPLVPRGREEVLAGPNAL